MHFIDLFWHAIHHLRQHGVVRDLLQERFGAGAIAHSTEEEDDGDVAHFEESRLGFAPSDVIA
jgi:hypothetical protein